MARVTKAEVVKGAKLGRVLARMTPKQRKLTEERLADPEATIAQIGQAAGFKVKVKKGRVVSPGAERALASPLVRSAIELALDAAGAPLASAAKVIAEAQQAKETKFFAYEGVVQDERDVIDHPTRLRAAELNLKSRKVLGEAGGNTNIQVNQYGTFTDQELALIVQGKASPADFLK